MRPTLVKPFSKKIASDFWQTNESELVNEEQPTEMQTVIAKLQEEVRGLQAALLKTRRELEQQNVLLRNSLQRENELRTRAGVGETDR